MRQHFRAGRFLEDFRVGETLLHPTPRTLTEGDRALLLALYPHRFALNCSDPFARACGYRQSPIDDLAVFHIVFGKSVPDVSRNAIANLGYAECRFLRPAYPGDTLTARSEVIGLRQNSSGRSGVVHVRTRGLNQDGDCLLTFVRWVMVRKRDPAAPAPATVVPELAESVPPDRLAAPAGFRPEGYDFALAGSASRWSDYTVGDRIDHVDGVTLEDAEHMLATRLWQNTARVHFDAGLAGEGRFGRRIVYGGHIISLARALTFNGLENAQWLAAINAGSHVAPCFAGDTIHAWSEVLARAPTAVAGLGALRLRTVALQNRSGDGFPHRDADGRPEAGVVLDLDWWALLPR